MNKAYTIEKLQNYNSNFSHPPYFLERQLLSEIRAGLLDEALTTLHSINMLERSRLSSDPTRSLKNSLIASCTLFSRAAIETGVDPEDSFSLSDSFIKRIEKHTKQSNLSDLEYEMVKEFTLMIQQHRTQKYTRPVSRVINHINENTTSKLGVRELADVAHLSPDHLSRVFFKEVGIHLTDYIQQRKTEVAKIFLEFSSMRIADIAAMLEFCNAAYFTKIFKKHTGVSAAQYRNMQS